MPTSSEIETVIPPKFKTTLEERVNKPYCDPGKRMDFIFFFEAIQSNPNGDPDAGNLPRIDPTDNHGIVTDVATKRKIRDYLHAAYRRPIFIQNRTALNTLYFNEARDLKNKLEDSDKDKKEVESVFAEISAKQADSSEKKTKDLGKEFLQLFEIDKEQSEDDEKQDFEVWLIELSQQVDTIEYDSDEKKLIYSGDAKKGKHQDIEKEIKEAIGEVPKHLGSNFTSLCKIIAKTAKGGGSRKGKELVKRQMAESFDDIRLFGAVLTGGTNAGQIRGPLQLTFARSEDPIIPIESSITRCAITTAADFLKKETEMGRKPWVSWALYRQCGFYNAPLGAAPEKGGTGVTCEDLARFWEAFAHMFQDAKSAANGRIQVRDLIVFVHDDPSGRGCAPFHMLEKKINLQKKKRISELTKGYEEVYEPITIEDEDKMNKVGVTVHRPLEDLWPDL